jgi:hypothetical protein
MRVFSILPTGGVFVAAMIAAGTMSSSASADLIAYWHFNDDIPGNVIPADQGAGSIDTASFGGSVQSTAPFAGTSQNAKDGVPAGFAMRLVGTAGNTTSIDFNISMTNMEDLVVSYATERNTGGFTSQSWAWSIDGTTFHQMQTASVTTLWEVRIIDFSSATDLNDAANVTLRLTFDGATAGTGRNQLDNIQIRATSTMIPAPGTLALLGLTGFIGLRRRR